MNMKRKIYYAIIAVVILLNAVLGLLRLEKYSAVDEPYWTYDRTPQFWTAVKEMRWKKTNINDKPGITVALLSGAGLWKYNPMAFKDLRDDQKTDGQLEAVTDINFYFRLPIFLFILAMLPLFYHLLRKLFDEDIALVGFLGIALSPIIFGISLIINPDSLLWLFLPSSILSLLVYAKSDEKKYLYLSGLFFGLSLLTKYVSNILYAFYIVVPFAEYIFTKEKLAWKPFIKKWGFAYIQIVLISAATFFLLYPATWKDIDILLEGTIMNKVFDQTWPIFAAFFATIIADYFMFKGKVIEKILAFVKTYRTHAIWIASLFFLLLFGFVLLNTYTGMHFYDFQETIASPKNNPDTFTVAKFFENIFADVYSLLFGLTPLFFVGIFTVLIQNILNPKKASKAAIISLYLLSFIILYYIGSSVNYVVATVRYQIVIYPLAIIVGAIGLMQLFELLKRFSKHAKPAFVVIIFISSVASLLLIKPFYFAYSSILLPPPICAQS